MDAKFQLIDFPEETDVPSGFLARSWNGWKKKEDAWLKASS